MNHKTLIVFDIDGTLAHSEMQHQSAYIKALEVMGMSNINTNWIEYQHITDSHIFKINYQRFFNRTANANELEHFDAILFQKILTEKSITEIIGAKKLIEQVTNSASFDHVFATGSMQQAAFYKLDSIGIDYDKKLVLTANEWYSREEIVSAAIETAKSFYQQKQYQKIISIGDGVWDYKTAQNLNLEFIGIGAKIADYLIDKAPLICYPNLEKIEIYDQI